MGRPLSQVQDYPSNLVVNIYPSKMSHTLWVGMHTTNSTIEKFLDQFGNAMLARLFLIVIAGCCVKALVTLL